MIPAGQPINEDLETRKFAKLQARREPDLTRTSAGSHDIKLDESQRVFVLPTTDGMGARAGVIAGALIITGGLTWLVISALPSPFASESVDRSSGGLNSAVQIPPSNKGDRLPVPNAFIHEAVSASSRETAVAVAPREPKQSSDTQRQADSIRKLLKDAEHQPTSIGPNASRALQAPVKLAPVPETRPATIEGWTLRDVMNGTAVLDGPNGSTWHVTRGDTVPGVGRIVSIFRWGNRLMVATSTGLISTP